MYSQESLIGVVLVLGLLIAALIISVALLKAWGPAFTFPYALALLEEEQVVVCKYSHPWPHLEMFGLNNSFVFVEYVRIQQSQELKEVLHIASYGFAETLRVDFNNQNIIRINNQLIDPTKLAVNCASVYELRTIAEKISQEYLRVLNPETAP